MSGFNYNRVRSSKRKGTQGTLTEHGHLYHNLSFFKYKYCHFIIVKKLSPQRLAPNNGSCVSLILRREGAHNQPHLKSWFIEEIILNKKESLQSLTTLIIEVMQWTEGSMLSVFLVILFGKFNTFFI